MSEEPFECTGCQNVKKICYKEIDLSGEMSYDLCENCPYLKKKLHGIEQDSQNPASESFARVCCAKCGLSSEDFLVFKKLGCPNCFSTFETLISKELIKQKALPEKVLKACEQNTPTSFYIQTMNTKYEQNPGSTRVYDLSEALSDALQKENYENAARLRDQINEIKEDEDEAAEPT